MIETLVAVGVLAAIGVAFLTALGATSTGTDVHEGRVVATSLAQSQVEYIKSQDYITGGDYDIIDVPSTYSVVLDIDEDNGRQEVAVKVYRNSEFVFGMTTLKVDW